VHRCIVLPDAVERGIRRDQLRSPLDITRSAEAVVAPGATFGVISPVQEVSILGR
jgi:hypothetical protein